MQLVLQQKELKNDVGRFTTHIKPVLQQIRLLTGFENAQQRFLTRIAEILLNKLHFFVSSY